MRGVWLLPSGLFVLAGICQGSSLVPQKALSGSCIPRFRQAMPVFGEAGSIPRVDANSHKNLTVQMKEISQTVLPANATDTCGLGITFNHATNVWAYETRDTLTGRLLGPAHWPAVTIDAKRYKPTTITYVNQLPSFGSGEVQGLVSNDQKG